eukprot:CAMPEP_0114992226 /NCGR_PEP_ID=MMETSP0216-20121206/11820_1 /TAXON_ID=223996 /ORGANISM="Protocruzia adherens, Strain Boccale" /LENGTH=176 /DNA_ID=CAMNT_0002355661 /DNA_START=539 /DNA_END=1069 /DNA_ORIENTATION=-
MELMKMEEKYSFYRKSGFSKYQNQRIDGMSMKAYIRQIDFTYEKNKDKFDNEDEFIDKFIEMGEEQIHESLEWEKTNFSGGKKVEPFAPGINVGLTRIGVLGFIFEEPEIMLANNSFDLFEGSVAKIKELRSQQLKDEEAMAAAATATAAANPMPINPFLVNNLALGMAPGIQNPQ